MAEYAIEIDGVERDALLSTINLQMVASGVDTLTFDLDSADASYRPALDESVVLTRDGTPIFKGVLTSAREEAHGGPALDNIVTRCAAVSQDVIATYRYITETIPAGSTLKQALQQIDDYFTDWGITLAAGQVNGPTFDADVTFTRVRGDEVLNRFAELTGYLWEINADDELEMFAPGSRSAPGNLLTTGPVHQVGDVTIEPTRDDLYCNRVILVITGAGPATSTEIFTAADGVTSGGFIYFTTKYPSSQSQEDAWPNVFILNGVVLGPVGFIGIAETGAWDWDPVNHRLRYTIASGVTFPAGADEITVTYAIAYPFEVIVDNLGSPPDPIREIVITQPEGMTIDEATAYAQALLDRRSTLTNLARFDSHTVGWAPGQSLTITLPKRNTNATFLVQDVVMRAEVGSAPGDDAVMRYQITALQGDVNQGNWRKLPQAWLGGNMSSSGGVATTGGLVTQFFDYAQHVVVAKSGGDFDTIQAAIDSITDASANHRYIVDVKPGRYTEQVTMKSWISLRGASSFATVIDYDSADGALKLADFVQIDDIQIANSSTEGHWGIVGVNTSHWGIRNVQFIAPLFSTDRGAGIKVTGSSWNTGFIEHVLINTYTQTNHGIFLESDGSDLADVTINDVFVDSFEATTGGSILLNNLRDSQLRNIFCRTSSAGYDLRIAGASEITLSEYFLEFGTSSLEIGSGSTVEVTGVSGYADSISNSGTLTYSVNDNVIAANAIQNAAVTTNKLDNGAVTEVKQTLSDVVTWDVSTTRHGYVPKAPNDADQFLDGTGQWSTPAGFTAYVPLAEGTEPLTFISDGFGQPILIPYEL